MDAVPYEKQTVDNPNPIARFDHRARMRKSKQLVMPFLTDSVTLLDYGCGQGRFLHELARQVKDRQPHVSLLGYDPYLSARFDGYTVVSDAGAMVAESVDILTSLKVCEHLTEAELQSFVDFAVRVLAPQGRLLVTVPIEIGPVVLLQGAQPERAFPQTSGHDR